MSWWEIKKYITNRRKRLNYTSFCKCRKKKHVNLVTKQVRNISAEEGGSFIT